MKPVIHQIEQNLLLEFLTEIRRVTTLSLDIIPNKCPDNELILLVDKCFLLLHRIARQHDGCVNITNLYDRNIFFSIVFGTRGCDGENQFRKKMDETCKNAIICATQILQELKDRNEIHGVLIGISTDMAYCGVIGHNVRKYYAIIGPSVEKAMSIMDISYDKISCDYDTLFHSRLSKDQFRSRGLRILRRSEKYHVYEYLNDTSERNDLDVTMSLNYCYPILGRLHELEDFNDVLDEIGVEGRHHAGLLIEGGERSGKSRLLDAFVTSIYNRQIRVIKLSLHMTYAEKAYAVIHHLILQILEAEDCETVAEREKVLLTKLINVLDLEDFCYLNISMRVRFPLSDTYCSDSDWRRHMKMVTIFETILKQLKTKICILLDDVQYMDYVSWQFFSSALDDNNVVMAMTISKSHSSDNSYVEAEIRKDKRLMKRTLLGLDLDLLPAFACQFLNVLAIPRKLSRILQRREDGHIGWCEAFLTLILQDNALNFVKITPSEAEKYDLVFPKGTLVTKLPVELMPEELAPPLPWLQMTHFNVCVTNKRYYKTPDINLDMKGLISEIYERMNPYEQTFITCAATLGTVFKRNVLQNIISSAILPYITKIVSEMVRMRILECASLQRRDFYSEDLALCILKKRKTFSDMHHLVSCHCRIPRTGGKSPPLSLYAQCKTLEFKIDLFRKMMYDMQSDYEKQENHAKAAKMYRQNARKCSTCGGGTFLKIPSKETKEEGRIESPRISLIRRRTIAENRNSKLPLLGRGALSLGEIPTAKRHESTGRRVSIMPSYLDTDENEVSRNNDIRGSLMGDLSKFWGRFASIAPETLQKEPSQRSCLEQFSHIDYRNCRCDRIVSCLFWKLHQHIENSEKMNKILDFLMEYSAGLIQTAQPSYAIKLLSIAAEKHEVTEINEWLDDKGNEHTTNKGIILALTGDAYNALGNYAQAKKYYTEAMMLQSTPWKLNKVICYDIVTTKLYCKLQKSLHQSLKEISEELAVKNLELASYMGRRCVMFLIEDKLKAAKLFALRSINLGFPMAGGFLVKGEIYLAAVRVLHRTRNIELMRCIERSMLTIIKTKINWHDVEEMAMVANIYFATYQIRALRGELEEAVCMGTKVLKISGTLRLNNLMLTTMPSLIQVMLWTQRINEAIDLMKELYFLAEDDVDLSAKTWYYALSLELSLDAGVIIESYEASYNYYKTRIVNSSKSCVTRDPQSLCRLLTCLWIYQFRTGQYMAGNQVPQIYSAETYIKDVSSYDFSRIFTCSKGLECYLLILLRCVNMKQSNELLDLIQDVYKIIKCLNNVSSHAMIVKPCLYLLMAYLNVIRGRKSVVRFYLYRAEKYAALQGNKMIAAWIIQNRRMWIKNVYNNMAQYWLENIGSPDFVAWQYVRNFTIDVWSTILYSLPIPDSYL